MENLKISDVRSRGCYYTLYPAAKEAGVCEETISELLYAMYEKVNLTDQNGLRMDNYEDILEGKPDMPLEFSVEDFKPDVCAKLLEEGLLKDEEEKLIVTQKALGVLIEAAKIQNRLDEEGFFHKCCGHCSCCGC